MLPQSSSAPTQSKRRQPGPILTGLLVLATVGGLACGPDAPPDPSRTLPRLADDARVDPEIRARVEEAFERALDGSRESVRELADVYAANSLWDLAEQTYRLVPDSEQDPRIPFHRGRALAMLGRAEEAEAAFARSEVLEPGYGPTRWRRGDVLLELGRLEEAEREYRTALELEPGSPRALLGLARVALADGRPQEAADLLEPVVRRDPKAPFANGLLARAWRQLGRPKRAEKALRREAQARPREVPDPWTAEVGLRATGLLVHLNRASAKLAAGDPRAATEELEPLLPLHPDDAALLATLARARTEAGEPDEALALLEGAPASGTVELARARALLALDRGDEARACLAPLVERDPDFGEAREVLGEIELERGDARSALSHLLAASESGRESPRLATVTARAALAAGDVEQAVASLRDAVELHPRSGSLWASLADAELRAGHDAEARAALDRAAERAPDDPRLGDLRARLARDSEEAQ